MSNAFCRLGKLWYSNLSYQIFNLYDDDYIFCALLNGLQVIDLTRVSQELAYLASDAELVILEGMGSSSLYSLLPTYNKILFKNLYVAFYKIF